MANETATITVGTGAWVQIALAGQQALITPRNPGYTFWVRFSILDPGTDVTTGHKYFAKDDIPNAVLGGTNTDNIWIRLVRGEDQLVEVTVL